MEDGLVEIMLGLIMTILSGLFLATAGVPRGPFADFMGLGGVQILFLVVVVSIVWGFKKLKARVMFPRYGYVALPEPTRKSRISMVATFAIFGVMFSLLTSTVLGHLAVPGAAVAFAFAFIVPGLRVRAPRMMWEGVLALVIGALLFLFTDLKGSRGLLAFMATIGTALAIIGSLQLRSFLRTHPTQQETEA
jgi:hypothetical protein